MVQKKMCLTLVAFAVLALLAIFFVSRNEVKPSPTRKFYCYPSTYQSNSGKTTSGKL